MQYIFFPFFFLFTFCFKLEADLKKKKLQQETNLLKTELKHTGSLSAG